MNPYKTLRSVIRFGPIETDRIERRLARTASVEDLRRIAKRRLPGGVFDYIDGGAEDERTLAANQAAFALPMIHCQEIYWLHVRMMLGWKVKRNRQEQFMNLIQKQIRSNLTRLC